MKTPKAKNVHIQVLGLASGKVVFDQKIALSSEGEISLLAFFARRKINLASSCNGKGICKKCSIGHSSKKILACQTQISSLLPDFKKSSALPRLIFEVDYF